MFEALDRFLLVSQFVEREHRSVIDLSWLAFTCGSELVLLICGSIFCDNNEELKAVFAEFARWQSSHRDEPGGSTAASVLKRHTRGRLKRPSVVPPSRHFVPDTRGQHSGGLQK